LITVSQIVVSLKARDPVAMTATQAIREKMGIESLENLELSDLWELGFDLDSEEEALKLTGMLVERSIIFVNPNKHDYTVRMHPSDPVRTDRREDGNGIFVVAFLRERFEDPVLAERIRRRFDLKPLTTVKRARLWVLRFGFEDPEHARLLAEEIARAESRRKGLLVNPHAESFLVYTNRLPVGVIG